MAFPGFTAADFKVFDIAGFAPRMDAIRTRIRPKLEAAGRDLVPDVSRIGGAPAFTHVAKHAPEASATVRLRSTGTELLLEVADDGPGFDLAAAADWARNH